MFYISEITCLSNNLSSRNHQKIYKILGNMNIKMGDLLHNFLPPADKMYHIIALPDTVED